jgi:hypothetical protein
MWGHGVAQLEACSPTDLNVFVWNICTYLLGVDSEHEH